MSLNVENLVIAFESDSGKAAEAVWSQFHRYLCTVTTKQGAGLSRIVLRTSAMADKTVNTQLEKKVSLVPAVVKALCHRAKSSKLDDVSGSFLLQYALEVLLFSPDAAKVSPGDFSGLFKSISIAELSSILAPALVRALRRSASKSIHNVAGILECCAVDMSESSVEIVGALLDSQSNAELLNSVSRGLGAIFRLTQSEAARLEIVRKISAAFPRFGQQSVDNAAATILSAVFHSLPHATTPFVQELIASPLIVGLQKQVRAAPADETRCKIAESFGALLALAVGSVSDSQSELFTAVSKLIKEDLLALLVDKKSTDLLKATLTTGLESICLADKNNSLIGSCIISFDSIAPLLPLLTQGRLTARTTCLAAWSVALHCALVDGEPDKKLIAAFTTAVSSDQTFCPIPGEDSALNRRLLRTIAELALAQPGKLPLFNASEMETISLGVWTPEQRMRNRFCVNVLKTIAWTSSKSFDFGEKISSELCNRFALALYEIVVAESKGLPGHLTRIALDRVLKLVTKMEADWAALTLLLCQHEYFASHAMTSEKIWNRMVKKNNFLEQLVGTAGPVTESLTGLCFQPSQPREFRAASLRAIPKMNSRAEQLIARALAVVSPQKISECESDVAIFFCPENVVWRQDTEDWIPSPETTLKPEVVVAGKQPAPQVKKGGVTREDMMRDALKEQAIVRRRIGELADKNRFALDVVSKCVEMTDSVVPIVTAQMHAIVILLKSALTTDQARKLIDSLSSILLPANSCSDLLYAVAVNSPSLVETEQWTQFLATLPTELSLQQTQLVWPIVSLALAPRTASDFDLEVALAALDSLIATLESSSPWNARAILESIIVTARISPGPAAGRIGKMITLAHAGDYPELLVELVKSDDSNLVTEVANSLHSIPIAHMEKSAQLQALVVMGSLEEAGKVSFDLLSVVPSQEGDELTAVINVLTPLLHSEPLVQRLASQSLAQLCITISTASAVLGICEQEFLKTGGSGFATALGAISKIPICNDEQYLSDLIRFVIGSGMELPTLTLPVRDLLLSALEEALTSNGQSHAQPLMTLAESFIGKTKSEAAGLTVPVILGLLTKSLPVGDPRIDSVRTKLVAELLTSEPSVQVKIAAVLPPLLKLADDVSKYLESFLNTALTTSDGKARYGAALGVGAAVKAQGVGILRQLEVLKKLQDAAEDSKNSDKRQGAIAVYGGLSLALGRLFEPYVAQILPVLLVAFGDGNANVREASNIAASQIMASLSTHGIKLVLPSLLNGVNDLQWRTKLGSIKLLSAMLRCAPKQLSTCLPKVVPALSEVATDTHSKVREAACASLVEVEGIIVNPEIRACSHKLIAALTDPANDHLRQEALDVLLSTSFVHSLDAASLALVIPVMLRATRERRSEIKRKGAQILGSVAVLSADPQEGLGPYMDRIVPALEDVLVDPIPDVRATAAKAMGTMARALPAVMVQEVLPWLFKTLKEAESQVERSGAAHGLSEVLVELGPEHFVKILPEVIANASNPATNPEAREGYLGLFVFLPTVMRQAFVPHIETVFPVLIEGLSDAHQPVREVACRAANSLCVQFGASHATLLLPSLERGLFAKDWRARQASVLLTGETLEVLMKNSRGGNRDNLLESQVSLTQEKRSYMLAMLYIVRSDVNPAVNQNAQSIWKRVVSNTPRTLRMILPILVRLLIANLSAGEGEETRQVLAARCLGDLVGKLGDRVLPDLMPILMENASSPDATVRAGVCVGLSEIVNACQRQLLHEYFSIMFPAIRAALCDESSLVRGKAGSLFSALYVSLGNTAVNYIVPQIIDNVKAGESGSVQGLAQLVHALSKELMLSVIDALATEPVTAEKVRGLETVSAAPAAEVAKFVSRITSYLMGAYSLCPEETLHCGNELFRHFNRHSCHLALIELIRGLGDNNNGQLREACAILIASCVRVSPLEVVAEYTDTLVPVLVRGNLADPYQPAMEACLQAFAELTTKITKETMVKFMRVIADTVDDVLLGGQVPGLGLNKTFENLWLVYQQALMFGSSDAREAAAEGLVVLIKHTPYERLKPNAIKVTGPLIRVLGDRYPANVRIALLQSLELLIERLETALKPFLPQLQTTYQKCAQDTEGGVRQLAEASQALLSKLSAKP